MRFFTFILLVFIAQNSLTAQGAKDQKVVSGIVLENSSDPINAKTLISSLQTDWKIQADSLNISEKTIVFKAGNATVMIAQLNYPADPNELRAAAQLSWLWTTAAEEVRHHKTQVVISIIGTSSRALELHQLFTKVAAAVLESSQSSGVYMDSQYLLISKGFYSAAAHNMLDNQNLPIYCWVYFGMPGDGGAYTFGMSEFGFPEMEIVNSTEINSTVHALIYDAATSVIKYNTRPADDAFIITEEGTKIQVKLSKGQFLEGQNVLLLQI